MKSVFIFSCFLLLLSCSSAPRMVVDPSTISDAAQYESDRQGCLEIAKTFDLTDEKALKGIAGAAIGGTAVAGIATAVAGAVFAPAIPWIVAGSLAGGGIWGSSASKEEKIAREKILVQCLNGKGYTVYSTD